MLELGSPFLSPAQAFEGTCSSRIFGFQRGRGVPLQGGWFTECEARRTRSTPARHRS